jgi:DNA (cytosine-5)-methyltransferase 1
MGNGWSIAWRVHDAQFWGVPQRRKRIALVADFGGDTAPEILFERKSLSGDIEESREKGKGTSTSIERNTDPSSFTLKIRGGCEVDSKGKKAGKGPLVQTELSGTLGVSQDQTLITKCMSVDEKMGQTYVGEEVGNTLGARDYKQPQAVVYGMSGYESNAMKSSNPHSGIYEANTTRTLDNNGGNPACNQGGMIVLEGNGTRPSHKGDGYKESDTMYTLNGTEQHGVCTYQETTGTLNPGAHAGSYNGQDAYNDMLVIGGGVTYQ